MCVLHCTKSNMAQHYFHTLRSYTMNTISLSKVKPNSEVHAFGNAAKPNLITGSRLIRLGLQR